jgi:1-deoxy-D-xylulose-5-phosphate synthase
MLEGTGLGGFKKEFPERTFDVGIAEEHAVICAAGMACAGLRPVVCIYSTFMQRAFDPVIHDVALQRLPVVFSLDRGGLVGEDGPTHHGAFDLSYLRMIPGMVVMAPMDAAELRRMTDTALAYEDGPIALRFPRGAAEPVESEPAAPIGIGKAQLLRQGDEVCLVGIGLMANHALAAADLLKKKGIHAGVINARFVKPLDEELLVEAAGRYSLLVTVEDNALAGGFGSAVLELAAQKGLDVRIMTLGLPDRFIEHGARDTLYDRLGLSPRRIAERVREILSGAGSIQSLVAGPFQPAAGDGK